MSEFEEFFRGEPVKVGGTIASSGFQHQEEKEYFENLKLSGAFFENQLSGTGKIHSTPTEIGISPVFREEFEQQKDFENVFDIVEDRNSDDADANTLKLTAANFRQYSLTS